MTRAEVQTRFVTPRRVLSALLLILGACLLAGWWLLKRTLPRLDGDVYLPDLKQEVTVDRDQWGIPWIRAHSLEDLEVAQGYVVAQDRLWQMDVLRRSAAGELSEIFGPVTLSLDRENRTLGLHLAAEDAATRMDPDTRRVVEAYARGVNRYIEEHRNRLPIEFSLLRYRPHPWTPKDSFLISAYMWKALTTSWKAKLNRARVTALVGPEKARELFVIDSPLDHFIVGNVPAPEQKITRSRKQVASDFENGLPGDWILPASLRAWADARDFLAQFETGSSAIVGSNNFVVKGAHTASGKPLLANDTHLMLGVPDIWYIAHLTAPGWNVKGFTFPGSPLVIIGHNDRIAWGFTNSNIDVQDLYVETFNPADALQYRAEGAWATAQTRRELIHVKGHPDDILDVVLTRHGPIVHRDSPAQGGRAYALRWTLAEPGGMDFGFPMIGRANNWAEFLEAMRRINGPGQNAVYADVDGNIGFFIAARIPLRRSGNGALPVSGETNDYEWTGYVPFDELPKALNPPEGIIATANARTVGPGYRYFLSERWAGPERTARIYQLLSGRNDLRPADFNTIQNDIVSSPDRFLSEQLIRAAQSIARHDPRVQDLIARLPRWDGRAAAGSVETSFLEYTRHALMKNLLHPWLGDETSSYKWWEPEANYNDVWWRDKAFLQNILRTRPPAWLPKPFTSYDELLIASAEQAVLSLEAAAGSSDTSRWNWGRLHPLLMLHPLGRHGILKRLLSIGPFEQGGTIDTVKAMGHDHGPAMRFVADLSNFDSSLMEITTGESGQYGSAHYRDQFPSWLAGRGIPAPFSESAEDHNRAHRLQLLPGKDSRSDSP